jgi:hypothetical protein
MSSAELVTLKHIKRVSQLLGEFAIELIRRGNVHDNSKFEPEELVPLQHMQELVEKEGQASYGSDEYKRRLGILKPMLDHHYKNNSHHPEHYENGIDDMSLYDIVEMFCDWKAASERGEESEVNLSSSKERFNISDQLFSIFESSCKVNNWKYK